jgi:hypothetical protein
VGAYRTTWHGLNPSVELFSWWNGKSWSNSKSSLKTLEEYINKYPQSLGIQNKFWQGMTENRYPDDGTK